MGSLCESLDRLLSDAPETIHISTREESRAGSWYSADLPCQLRQRRWHAAPGQDRRSGSRSPRCFPPIPKSSGLNARGPCEPVEPPSRMNPSLKSVEGG